MTFELSAKEIIKPFKNDTNSIWYKVKHWRIMDGKLILAAGGVFDQEDYNHVEKYFQKKGLL